MSESRPLIFRGKTIGYLSIEEATGHITGQVDPSMLTQLESMDLFWHAWTDRYVIETEIDL